jgi:DNA invertase Pin-like site-specific DNA recombinase
MSEFRRIGKANLSASNAKSKTAGSLRSALIDLTKTGGVEIDTVASGRIDLATADGRMIAGLLAQIDQGEAGRISERICSAGWALFPFPRKKKG